MTPHKRFRWLLSVALILLAASCSKPPAIDYSGPTADWPHYGAGLDGKRYSDLNQIRPDNVKHLEEVWQYNSGDISTGSAEVTRTSLQVTPIVVDDSMYFCTPFNRVISLNAETGAENWVFDPKLKLRKLHGAYPLTCRGVSYWRGGQAGGSCSSRIFTGTQDAELIALDAKTGEPCTDFGDGGRVRLRENLKDTPEWEYYVTSAPLITNDLVVVGALVADNVRANAPPGVVRAFDARSGALRWAWDPIPPGGSPPAEGEGPYRRSTANVWATMSADPENNLVFVPTGNAPPDYFGGKREGLDYYSSSVVAIHSAGPEAGQAAWRFQTVHHDLWDYDIGAQPTLFDFNGPQGKVPAVIVSTKMGHVFVLNRMTGEPLLPVEERPVPGDPAEGEQLSPTQPFPVKPPSLYPPKLDPEDAWGITFWDRGKCEDRIAELRSDGLFTPPTRSGSVHFPGALGGINWGSGALEPSSGVFVVNQSRVPTAVGLLTREEFDALPPEESADSPGGLPGTTKLYGPMEGTPYAVRRELLLSPWGLPCNAPPWGTLTAVDINKGEVLWEVALGSTREQAPWPFWFDLGVPNLGGPLITKSGLIFISATTDRYIRSFDLGNGKELWRARLPYAGHATPLTYRVGHGSKQFVAIAAGGHATSEPGDAIVAFALPDE